MLRLIQVNLLLALAINVSSSRYTLLSPLTRFCDHHVNTNNHFRIGMNYRQAMSCPMMVPGLRVLELGFNSYEHKFSEYPTVGKYHQVYEFTCVPLFGRRRMYERYRIPEQFQSINSTLDIIECLDYRVTPSSLLSIFHGDIGLASTDHKFVGSLSRLNVDVNRNDYSAVYFGCESDAYKASLKVNTELRGSVVADYNSLSPYINSETVKDYYNFSRVYGLEAIQAAVMGGKLDMVVSSSRVPEMNFTSNNFSNMTAPVIIKRLLSSSTTGDFDTLMSIKMEGGTYSENISVWRRSVLVNPIPLEVSFAKLSSIIEPILQTPKKTNFERIYEFEEFKLQLRKIKFQLSNIPTLNKLGRFLLRLVTDELHRMCPSNQLINILSQGIINVKNISLKLFGFKCIVTTRRGSTTSVKTQKFPIIPGVCVTFDMPGSGCHGIDFGNWSPCLYLYADEECRQSSVQVNNIQEFNTYFTNAKSMTMCSE